MGSWESLNQQIQSCERCPRLRAYCQHIAQQKRRAYADETYWGRPVPNFGDPRAELLIVGLAPAAHGANRTGRMFTGDRSGEWLFRALHKAGFANQAESQHPRDGLRLLNCCITAVCHCAPPDNKPTPDEISNCQIWLNQTLDLVPAQVFLALGQLAWTQLVRAFRARQWYTGANPPFGHRSRAELLALPATTPRWLIGSYHPSQQNTFTGKLTEAMFDAVFQDVRALVARASRATQFPEKEG